MNYKYCHVVDADGYKSAYVLVHILEDGAEQIQYYMLKDGERLVDMPPPTKMVKPCWNGTEWLEAASPEELATWKAERAAIMRRVLPTTAERLEAIEEALTDILMGGINV